MYTRKTMGIAASVQISITIPGGGGITYIVLCWMTRCMTMYTRQTMGIPPSVQITITMTRCMTMYTRKTMGITPSVQITMYTKAISGMHITIPGGAWRIGLER